MEKSITHNKYLSWKKQYTYDPSIFWGGVLVATVIFVSHSLYILISRKASPHYERRLTKKTHPLIVFAFAFWSSASKPFVLALYYFFFWCLCHGYFRLHWVCSLVFTWFIIVIHDSIFPSFQPTVVKNEKVYTYSRDFTSDVWVVFLLVVLITFIFYWTNTFLTLLVGYVLSSIVMSLVYTVRYVRHEDKKNNHHS